MNWTEFRPKPNRRSRPVLKDESARDAVAGRPPRDQSCPGRRDFGNHRRIEPVSARRLQGWDDPVCAKLTSRIDRDPERRRQVGRLRSVRRRIVDVTLVQRPAAVLSFLGSGRRHDHDAPVDGSCFAPATRVFPVRGMDPARLIVSEPPAAVYAFADPKAPRGRSIASRQSHSSPRHHSAVVVPFIGPLFRLTP